jgi:hypothetical protein
MATNREMLKEAIADAKAVKETAIANAKAALEEAFAPQLKSMLSMKLQEMEKEDELEERLGTGFDPDGEPGFDGPRGNFGKVDEYGMEHDTSKIKDVDGDGDVDAQDAAMMEIDLEELLAELNDEEKMEESINEAEEEEEDEESEESEEGEEEGEPLDLEDMTDEDLKDIIEDVIKDMIASGELEAGHEGEEGEEEGEEEEGEEEEIDLAELLREIEEMEEEKPVDEGLKSFLYGDPMEDVKAFAKYLEGKGKDASMAQAIYSEKDMDRKKEMLKDLDIDMSDMTSRFGKRTKDVLFSLGTISKEERDSNRSAGNLFPAGGGFSESAKMKDELYEAYSTIEALKSELNEINLLNAKLLYTNKIFKAKNLNESQKVKVLSSFDKAKNVGEVKMVFETLNEGIKVSKNTIKENLGSASKGTMTPSVKKPIVESNDAFLRMQKLAGII